MSSFQPPILKTETVPSDQNAPSKYFCLINVTRKIIKPISQLGTMHSYSSLFLCFVKYDFQSYAYFPYVNGLIDWYDFYGLFYLSNMSYFSNVNFKQ